MAENRSTYLVGGWLFVRLLGLAYLCAFWSLAQQVIGLIGQDGILPAREYMQMLGSAADAQHIGWDRFHIVPTLMWVSTNDAVLQGLCAAGAVLGALLAAGAAPALLLPLLWVMYLSLAVVCREFLSYQWDALLLEVGLLAIPLARWTGWDRFSRAVDPPRLARLATMVAVITFPASVATLAGQMGVELPGAALMFPVMRAIDPFRSVNPYGLFAVMTTTRPEIVVEGSRDGMTWLAYEFRHKTGDEHRRPSWVAPFQPRLDWQMWFAALGHYDQDVWFQRFCLRLLQGSPSVLALLADDPFQGRPPQFVRGTLYRYRFAEATAHVKAGAWWTREPIGPYSPVLSIGGSGQASR